MTSPDTKAIRAPERVCIAFDYNGTASVTLQQRKRLIAAQLGIAPETFSRVLRNLRDNGLVSGSGNVLQVPRPDALRQAAGM